MHMYARVYIIPQHTHIQPHTRTHIHANYTHTIIRHTCNKCIHTHNRSHMNTDSHIPKRQRFKSHREHKAKRWKQNAALYLSISIPIHLSVLPSIHHPSIYPSVHPFHSYIYTHIHAYTDTDTHTNRRSCPRKLRDTRHRRRHGRRNRA